MFKGPTKKKHAVHVCVWSFSLASNPRIGINPKIANFEYFSDHTKFWIIWQNLPGEIEFVEMFQGQRSTFVPFSLETSGIRWHEACKSRTRRKATPTSQKVRWWFSQCIVRYNLFEEVNRKALTSTFLRVWWVKLRGPKHIVKIPRTRYASQAFQCIFWSIANSWNICLHRDW